ncbi:hypothetical protein THAR02_11362, partial [Trichoderma harzianum]
RYEAQVQRGTARYGHQTGRRTGLLYRDLAGPATCQTRQPSTGAGAAGISAAIVRGGGTRRGITSTPGQATTMEPTSQTRHSGLLRWRPTLPSASSGGPVSARGAKLGPSSCCAGQDTGHQTPDDTGAASYMEVGGGARQGAVPLGTRSSARSGFRPGTGTHPSWQALPRHWPAVASQLVGAPGSGCRSHTLGRED